MAQRGSQCSHLLPFFCEEGKKCFSYEILRLSETSKFEEKAEMECGVGASVSQCVEAPLGIMTLFRCSEWKDPCAPRKHELKLQDSLRGAGA